MEKIAAPTYSPWDSIQHKRKLAEGVYWVSTTGHGGLMVHALVANDDLTPQAREEAIACNYSGQGWYAFEEDSKYAIAFFEQPEWMRASRRDDLESWKRILADPYESETIKKMALERVEKLTAQLALTNAQFVEDQRLLHTISMWDAQYLINRAIKIDPDGYAKWLHCRDRDRRLLSRCVLAEVKV